MKNRAREEKANEAKAENGTHFVVCQDVQSVKVCPSLNASALYYKTKLCCHNFTIYNLATHDAVCYWFTESQADLSANTFTSCLISFLKEKWPAGSGKPINVWSDGCTNQNRNAVMSNGLLSFSREYNVEITQKFFQKDTPKWRWTQFMP